MKTTTLLSLAALLSVGNPSVAPAEDGPIWPVVAWDCRDVVAVGRIKNLDYQLVDSDDDILGYGLITMEIRIGRVLRGKEVKARVLAKTIAHAKLVENRDFLLVLSPTGGGQYNLRSADLWRQRPHPVVADRCADAIP